MPEHRLIRKYLASLDRQDNEDYLRFQRELDVAEVNNIKGRVKESYDMDRDLRRVLITHLSMAAYIIERNHMP